MPIASSILAKFPNLNPDQKEVVAHDAGPLLIIAGPGSGKTFSLVLRALNLLLQGKCVPSELVICTFTEKAAYELRDRLASNARQVGYTGDLSDLRVGTIHGLCHQLLSEFRHHTALGNSFGILDELTRKLFLYEHFQDIFGDAIHEKYLYRWKMKWTAIQGVCGYFDKITEELVEVKALAASPRPDLRAIAHAYTSYRKALVASNQIDFALLQKLVYTLLQKQDVKKRVADRIKYVLVDEYQDTNYLQEQILFLLASSTKNLCVVGDEDQSLYRFRGATVRNILEFPQHFPQCQQVKLLTNYRSHEQIVKAYDKWMATADWTNASGPSFRYEKTIEADNSSTHEPYPAVISIWGKSERDEASRFADMVAYLKAQGVIEDYSQVALLLRSVRIDHSGPYLEALEAKGIPAFCPRARAYFDYEEVRLMMGCLAVIFGYYGEGRGNIESPALQELSAYVDCCIVDLARSYADPHPLSKTMQALAGDIANLQPGQSLDLGPSDYFYRLLTSEPFNHFIQNENRARRLAILSQLLNTFQNYYHYQVVTHSNRESLRLYLFNSFFRLLHQGGINDYEDPEQPFPKGYVQVMTIHQSKGLEFPVVVVGSLDAQVNAGKSIDKDLQPYYQRPAFEPMERISAFDRMRLHYVAFSRAEKLLVLTCSDAPKDHFTSLWQGLPQWPYVQKDVLGALQFELKNRIPVKRAFSFTGDLKVYETCPRQYQFFREYDFTPSRSAVIFFGLLVHQSIEEIHRFVLDGKLATLTQERIRQLFERTFSFLQLSDVHAIGEVAKESAFQQVMNYFHQNQEDMERILETEVDVSVEKDGYILTGKVDLLMGSDGKLELLDFKTSARPEHTPALLKSYEQQLCTYAHILEKRYNKRPERLLLYWTGESEKQNAVMEFPYRPELFDEAGQQFDAVVKKIQDKDFKILTPPERKVCNECDLRTLCSSESIIPPHTSIQRKSREVSL